MIKTEILMCDHANINAISTIATNLLFVCLLVDAVEMFVKLPFGQQGGCTSAALFYKVLVKVAVFADFVVGLIGDFKHRIKCIYNITLIFHEM